LGQTQPASERAANMSADAMLALMNNRELLMGGTIKGSTMSGNNRDADGSVDRVRDPPESLKPLLKKIKRVIDLELIDLHTLLKEQGATPYGTMIKSRFNSVLTVIFKSSIIFSHEDLFALDSAYGTGAIDLQDSDLGATYEYIAWMDFCEDIGLTDASFTPADKAPPLGFKPKAMSQQAMMLDAMDGVIDGKVDDSMWVRRHQVDQDGLMQDNEHTRAPRSHADGW